jgi:hypothetical protein
MDKLTFLLYVLDRLKCHLRDSINSVPPTLKYNPAVLSRAGFIFRLVTRVNIGIFLITF